MLLLYFSLSSIAQSVFDIILDIKRGKHADVRVLTLSNEEPFISNFMDLHC